MQIKHYFTIALIAVITLNQSHADCWFSCDSVNRNLASDFARTTEVLNEITDKTYSNDDKDFLHFCGTNDKNEMYVASLQKFVSGEMLVVNFSQYSPPRYGSTTWTNTRVDMMPTLRIAKTLNFGVVGLKDSISPDKRCRMVLFDKTNQQGNSFNVICNYEKNATLPVNDFGVALLSRFVPIDVCK